MTDSRSALLPLLGLLLALLLDPALALENRLENHPSPYLALHGKDPVHWQAWGPDILELAQREGKPIFVSSGYFACHWCHVMQRESFQDVGIAALLNEHFISVKVDRELEEALDAHLVEFVQRTKGYAGWPLSVILTPEGYPLIGTTYLPAEQFATLLRRFSKMWNQQRDEVSDLARRALLQMQQTMEYPIPEQLPSPEQLANAMLQQTMAQADIMSGGFGHESRFPMTPQMELLLELQAMAPDPWLSEFLQTTLDQMAQRGLRDHIGGGFFRYTVDPDWTIPHFEKMLYSQAQLASLYMRAAEVLQRKDYLEVAKDTLDFVLRDMLGPRGAFIASLSAVDEKGIEGAYYLWTKKELDEALPEASRALVLAHWKLVDASELESRLPMLGGDAVALALAFEEHPDAVKEQLDAARTKLLAHRARKSLPRDEKELLGWNGLLLGALAEAGKRFGDPYATEARKLAAHLARYFHHDGQWLRATTSDGKALGTAGIQDYAQLAWGLGQFAVMTGEERDASQANAVLAEAWKRFRVRDRWRADASPTLPGMAQTKAMDDGAMHSATATLIRLALGSVDAKQRESAIEATRAGLADVGDAYFWYPGHVQAVLGIVGLDPKETVDGPEVPPSGVVVR